METLKDYLVKITAQTKGLDEAAGKLKNLTRTIMMAMIGVRTITQVVMKAAQAVKAEVKETITLNDNLEQTAKSLKKTTQQARLHQLALSAMGKTMQEINKNKELKQTYDELVKIGKAFEFKEAPKGVTRLKDLQTELTKIKFSLKLGLSQVYEWFKTYASKPLLQLRNMLKDLAEKLNLKMGELSKKIGEWLAKRLKDLIELGMRLVAVAKQLWNWGTRLVKWINTMSDSAKTLVVVALGAIAMITGKLKPLHVVLTAIYLLVEDFAVWMQGGKSFFGDSWQKVVDFFEKLGKFLDDDFGKIMALAEALSFLTTGKGVATNIIKWALNSMNVQAGVVNVSQGAGTGTNGVPTTNGKPTGTGTGAGTATGLNYMVDGVPIPFDILAKSIRFKQALDSGDPEALSQFALKPVPQEMIEEAQREHEREVAEHWARYGIGPGGGHSSGAGASRGGRVSYGNSYPSYVNGSGGGGYAKNATVNTTATINVTTSNAMSAAQQVSQGLASIIAQNVQGALA